MRKVILIILLVGLLMIIQNHLQNSRKQAIMIEAPSGKSDSLEGYVSSWDDDFIYIIDTEDTSTGSAQAEERQVELNENTVFLRTYIDKTENLLLQEKIGVNDLIKDQFITIDVYKDKGKLEALIIRQIIYVEEEK